MKHFNTIEYQCRIIEMIILSDLLMLEIQIVLIKQMFGYLQVLHSAPAVINREKRSTVRCNSVFFNGITGVELISHNPNRLLDTF